MKYFVVGVLLFAVLTVSEGRSKKCSTGDDCEEDECCQARIFKLFSKGTCKKLAQFNESCAEPNDHHTFHGKQFLLHCPCGSGLSCEPEKIIEVPHIGKVKVNMRCVEGGTQEPQTEPEPVTEVPVTEVSLVTEVPVTE